MCLKIDTSSNERIYLKTINYPYSMEYRNNIVRKLQEKIKRKVWFKLIKPVIEQFFKYRNVLSKKGLDIVLLAKGPNNEYYRVKEYIGQVVSIQEGRGWGNMDKVSLKFFNNETYETETYLDSDIREGDIISIYGIIIKDGSKIELQCKGGSIRVYTKFEEAGRIYKDKIYKFGYAELSVIEPSIKYNIEQDKIKELEPNRLWFYVGNDIKHIEDEVKKNEENEKNGIIDFSKVNSFYVENTKDIETIE